MQRLIIPGVIDGQQQLCCLSPSASAQEAAELMAEMEIGAVLVVENGKLKGIVTERDLVYRVLAAKADAAAVHVAEIMTADPITIAPDERALQALEKMRAGRYRHLPVVRDGVLNGMVSIRDLYEAVRSGLEEELQSAESLIYGDRYGATAG